ncbi:MAG: glycerol-3-phosphate acyltransferase [Pseudomonadota bacterium]|nr:glycerol-3-phosphate acyltransferase [Pseudomonadota bacterium]
MQDLVGPAVGTLALVALGGYLLGSIPFGVVITRAAGAGDVRNIGSGNIGATNVLRTGRKDLALATLLLDAGKGAVALLIARALFDSQAAGAIAGGAAFLGHLFPVWLKFKGGKGVATFYGLLLAAVGLPVDMPILALTVFAAVLIWIRHHENIARLLKGEEPRIGAKKA